MSSAILFIWTIVGYASYMGTSERHDWRPMGEFVTKQRCEEAAVELGLKPNKFRCVETGKTNHR